MSMAVMGARGRSGNPHDDVGAVTPKMKTSPVVRLAIHIDHGVGHPTERNRLSVRPARSMKSTSSSG